MKRIEPFSLIVGGFSVVALSWLMSLVHPPAQGGARGPGGGGSSGDGGHVLDELLRHASFVYLDDGYGGKVETLRLSGINLQLVNGLEATNGRPSDPETTDPSLTKTNGTGNLILGYNELGNPDGDDRTGSHNIVCGTQNSYSSYGGLVVSSCNTISGAYASVSGGGADPAGLSLGHGNVAAGNWSSVGGGKSNIAGGTFASVAGGFRNTAFGSEASIAGGRMNIASGRWSSITAGYRNEAHGIKSSVTGGRGNLASGELSSVGGGQDNVADADYSTVGGGSNRVVSERNESGNALHDWIAGTLWEDR